MYKSSDLLNMVEEKISLLPLEREPHLLYEPIRYGMQEGGKRLRPLLLLLTANMFTDDVEQCVDTAVGVEMFHNFTLLHDDIMDNSPTRRGRDSVYRKWGTNVAILSGDTMMIYAYKLMLETQNERRLDVMHVFNQLSLELCEGQQIDMDFEGMNEVKMAEYLEMIRLKTSVLIAGAMQMGAILGGASENDICHIYDFGLAIGAAFQIQDDILDLYADKSSFGKPIGGDIIEGKKSYLILSALEKAEGEEREALLQLYNNRDIDPKEKVEKVRSYFDKYGIKEYAEGVVKEYFDNGLSILESLEVAAERKEELLSYAKSLLYRNK